MTVESPAQLLPTHKTLTKRTAQKPSFIGRKFHAIVLTVTVLITLTATRADTLYVTDVHTIQKYDLATGASLGTFASGLNNARGLAFDAAGNLYVANTGDGTLIKFNPSGTSSVFASGLNSPFGLCLDSLGNIYTSDDNVVVRFTPSGVKSVFATPLEWLGHVSTPRNLAFDADGNLYMTDEWYGAIHKFTSTGAASVFGYYPNLIGLAFDHAGDLYAGGFTGSAVVRFTPDGTRSSFAPTSLFVPGAMIFDSVGNLYVADYAGNRIDKFLPNGSSTPFATVPDWGPAGMAIQQVPEPSSCVLFAIGVSSWVLFRRK